MPLAANDGFVILKLGFPVLDVCTFARGVTPVHALRSMGYAQMAT